MKTNRKRQYRNLAIAGAVFLGAGLAGTVLAQSTPEATPARLIGKNAQDTIPDQYILVFNNGITANEIQVAQGVARSLGAKIGFTYTSALTGFSVTAAATALDRLRMIAGLSYIEADSKVSASIIQVGPPAGLDRTSERLLPLDNQYTYNDHGTGVHAYVIDTGIRITHNEFGGRASGAFTSIIDGFGTNDCHGHGTHVAGTLGGTTYGIAKNVWLHAVRVLDCAGSGTSAGVIAGVDWVTANAIHPAVANMSLGGGLSPALDTSVANSIASGVTYAVAAGNSGANACSFSPANVPTAITVGNVNPINDTRAASSNFGPCLDLFAPGTNTLSAWNTSDTATNTISGTSMAAPHVAGVAARYLQTHVAASPATVWAAIHYADDVSTTVGWPGIINPGAGSPNELLHWGSLNDGHDDGDPHLVTVGGIHYDFQSAGEFVMLRDGNGLQIQTRQSPVATTFNPGPNAYTGLASCVSLNTAVAARVGTHRISYQPNLSGIPDPGGLQLRIDGVLTTLGTSGLGLGAGGHVAPYGTGGGLEISFPDGTTLIATPHWWSSQSKWFLNVSVYHSPGSEGVMGALAAGSWLPALPSGASLGPKPAGLHQRYVDLNNTFANAWRVTAASSLFDYAPGTSTSTFTFPSWPLENPPCVIPASQTPPVAPLDPRTAQQVCNIVVDKNRKADCVSDVIVTGEVGFARAHRTSELIEAGSTRVILDDAKNPTAPTEEATFTASVGRHASTPGAILTGAVQFSLDGREAGVPIRIDRNGRAVWTAQNLGAGDHRVGARYIADQGAVHQSSTSLDAIHSVTLENAATKR
jgi:subtilisin family serine protease